jgi:cell fate regulator YaaT (PSP1 superfamily)
MSIIQVQFAPWDKIYTFFNPGIDLKCGDYVIVKTEMGQELGKVVVCGENEKDNQELKPVVRKANFEDINRSVDPKRKEEAMIFCKQAIDRLNLPMKLVDVYFSWEKNKINFAFISDGRVDFRDLVKELSAYLGANIRLTQIGTRDEAKVMGDYGPCGRPLCCRKFLSEFSSITSEMAEIQQVVHRGSERISGMCGRLKCCLSFEYDGYKELLDKLPPIGTKVKINGEKGIVCSHNILKQTINVKIPPNSSDDKETIIEVDPFRRKYEK